MLYKTLALAGLALAHGQEAEPLAKKNHYAVLVAGSNTYGNYRHQADVCHAYQVITAQGVPKKNIIVMAYDDIANNAENPFPGKIFNKPTAAGTPGVDVYAGCKIDYSKKDVTPENFIKVLTGDSSAPGPVLSSTKDDRVFINFVDHGATNLVAFPQGELHATELIQALQTMHDNAMYKELVFYLEACESGSMFAKLPADLNIYATTASNAKESSWGTYCMPDDKVDGKEIGSCLGDLYSVNWMEDSDLAIDGETLKAQFNSVVKTTNKSHVTEFGSQDVAAEVLTNFQGNTDKTAMVEEGVHKMGAMGHGIYRPEATAAAALKLSSSLPSADAEIASAYARFQKGSAVAAGELVMYVSDRQHGIARFDAISKAVAGKAASELAEAEYEMDCHYAAHKAYKTECGGWKTQTMVHSKTLAKLCAATHGDARPIVAAMKETCA